MSKRGMVFYIAFVCVIVLASSVYALDPMGPPVAGLKRGQSSAGVEYSESRMNFKMTDGVVTSGIVASGVFLPANSSSRPRDFTIKHVKMHKLYANLSYGLTDNWEAFVRIGGMNTEFRGDFFNSGTSQKFNGDNGFAIGFGSKVTLYEKDKLKIGALFQMSWAKSRAKIHSGDVTEEVELNINEMQIALGNTYQLTEKVLLYGGPFWHYTKICKNDAKGKRSDIDPAQNNGTWDRSNFDIDNIRGCGTYLGAEVEVAKNTFYSIEYMHTSPSDALGMSLKWKFQ